MQKIKITLILSAIFILTMPLIANATVLSDIGGNKNQPAIEYLFSNNVISGYPDGTFKPSKTVNRAELLKILVGGKGIVPTVEEYNNCFPDVKKEWFAPFVCYAKVNGWVDGYDDGTFKPSKDVNKVESLKMLVNSQGYIVQKSVSEPLFDDTDSTQWYAPFIQVAKEKGILETESGKYGVSDNMTRAGISENIYRSMVIKEKVLDKFVPIAVEVSESKVVVPTPKTVEKAKTYLVTKVVDGDTIEVDGTSKIRLIGVDTPETVDPRKTVQCFGQEASDIAKSKLLNVAVTLESDGTQDDKDKYGRLLRYVLLSDGTNFSKWLIENGYGHEYTYVIPYKYQSEFKAAETKAMNSKNGLWADNVCVEDKVSDVVQEPSVIEETATDYVCSSNTYNCTDFSNSSEAQKVLDYCKIQAGTDIHKLDGDNNGLACESL